MFSLSDKTSKRNNRLEYYAALPCPRLVPPHTSLEQSSRIYRVQALVALLVALGGETQSIASDSIYLSYSQDGVPFFSNSANDNNAAIFLRDSVTPKSGERQGFSSARNRSKEQLIPIIHQAALAHSMDPALVAALIDVESGFQVTAISHKGAKGLMQLIPQTAAQYGLSEPYDPIRNIDAGTRHLKDLLVIHNGNVTLAIAAYNAGQGSVSRYKRRIPPYGETLLYVPRVLAKLREYQAVFAERDQ